MAPSRAAGAIACLVGSAVATTAPLRAQCPDGTPLPCEVRRPPERVEPPPPEERARSFLVLPFRNLTRSDEHEWLVDGSVAMLTDALGRWREASVVPPRRLYPALQRHDLAPGEVLGEEAVRSVAAETGAWTVVDGEFLVTGSVVRVTARSYDVVTGEEIARAERELRNDQDPRDAMDAIAVDLLAGEDAAFDEPWGEASRATESIEAYRATLQGTLRVFALDFDGAREAYREAIALDSNYALPHAGLLLSVAARAVVYREPASTAQMLDPRSEASWAMRRAMALAADLPERERLILQGVQSMFRVEFQEAREAFERAIALDSTDVEALGTLGFLEIIDPPLVERGGHVLPRGRINEGLRLLKRVVMLAPNRHYFIPILARFYRETAGHFDGFSMEGWDREPQSLLDFATSPATLYFIPILRDSIELVPNNDSALAVLGPDTLRAARGRALQAARAWANEWLTAAPDEPRPHDFLSTLAELAGNDTEALSALERAEELETGDPFPGLAARRGVLLGKLGRFDDAARVLDSLWSVNRLRSLDREGWFPRNELLAHGWAVGLWLTQGRIARADSAWARLMSLPALGTRGSAAVLTGLPTLGTPELAAALTGTLPEATSVWWTYSAAELPLELLEPAVDSLLALATQGELRGGLQQAMPLLVVGTAEGMAEAGRSPAARALLEAVLEVEPTLEEARRLLDRLTRPPE